jgi:uncharacterized protein YegL
MKQDFTHITVLLDRSGSMESIREDTIGGFNAFLKNQKAEPGQATVTLVQFDTQDSYEVIHQFKPIQEVSDLNRGTYIPRGGTPLLDALGRGINDIEKRIGDLTEDDRPSKVIVAVVTDGQENSSHEFRKDQIEKMIKENSEKNRWQFVFLSADLAAIGDARAMGIQASALLMFAKNSQGITQAWSSLSTQASDYRSARKQTIGFKAADRKKAKGSPEEVTK